MREKIGMAICAAVLLYAIGSLAWALTAKPCEACGKLTVLRARLMRAQRRRRVPLCRRDQRWLKARGLIRPRGRTAPTGSVGNHRRKS